jgi:hypothetical protein
MGNGAQKPQAVNQLMATIAVPAFALLSGLTYFLMKAKGAKSEIAGLSSISSPAFVMMAEAASVEAPTEETTLDLDNIKPSDMEMMYINSLWAYYTEGKAILSDEEFARLKEELNWQGSGFPTLRREEIEFVKAVLAYAKGAPILSDEEYNNLKDRIKAKGKRQDVTAFLTLVKGQELLSPEEFAKLKGGMKAAGVQAARSASATLSKTPNTLQYDVLDVLYMYSALGFVPSAVCASAWGLVGWIFGGLGGVVGVATTGFPLIGVSSFLLTREMVRYLDLTGPKLVKGICPVCETTIEASFFDCTPAQKVEKCSNCGTLCNLDASKMLIRDVAGFQFIGDDDDDKKTVDQYLSWASGVASGILVGKNPISQLGGRKGDPVPDKPTNIPSLLQQEIKVGIFAWAVLLGYGLFGEKFVSRARGKGIAIHSGAINDFCKRFNIPNGLRQKYIQTAKRNGHDLGFLVDGYGLINDGLFGKQAMAWWKSQGW